MSVLTLLSIFLLSVSGLAGTTGTSDSEMQRLEDEVAEARNQRDAELLKRGAKPSDPSVLAKEKIVEEKLKAVRSAFQNRTTVKSDAPTAGGPAVESFSPPSTQIVSPGPVTELSGEGIQNEITYQKKSKHPLKKPSPTPELPGSEGESAPVTTAGKAGVSEIQYSKKGKTLPSPTASPVKKRN